MNGTCNGTIFWSPPPVALGRGQKVKYYYISITVNLKIFKPDSVCLLTNGRYETHQTGFSFRRLGHGPGVGLGGTMVVGLGSPSPGEGHKGQYH